MSDDNIEYLSSLDDKDPEEILQVKHFRKSFENFSLLASWFIGEIDWEMSGDKGREELMQLISDINTMSDATEDNLWVFRGTRQKISAMHDLLRDFARDMCWSDLPKSVGFDNPEEDHGLMVGLYAAVYQALNTSEVA